MQTCTNISTQAEKKANREGNRAIETQNRKNTYNIATWNVRNMYEGKLNIVQEEMNRKDIDILGIKRNEMDRQWTFQKCK
jgi:hypothetical protein